MKPVSKLVVCVLLGGALIHPSCKKEKSCEGCINGNEPPTAMAGPDQVITLPTDSISLDGSSSSDPDGTISEWLWTKISGPASFTINSATTAKTIVKDLIVGVYQFELKVRDNGGLSAKDTILVAVNDPSQPNRPPLANAGPDQAITLPTNTINLNGSSSTDPDNNITSYAWIKISGPSSFNITNANAVQTQVSGLAQGTYSFELKVTDVGGLFSKDTMQVIVNAQPTIPPPVCDNNNRPQINAQLIPVGNLSQARAGMAVASAGNKILFAGSGSVGSRVDIFDFVANTWSTAELSEPRAWIGAAAAGNKIFFAGGQYIDGYSSNAVDIYDVSTNTWAVSNLSRNLDGADGLAAVSSGNKVFFAGGNWGIYAVNIVDIYDLTTNTWSTASLSAPRNFITAVSANNKVYFTGGDLGTQVSSVIDIYDNITNTWSTSTLQVPRIYHSAVAVVDILYFGGGKSSTYQSVCSVETLDVNTGSSTLMNLFDPASWSIDDGQNAVVKDNKIIFLRHNGGANANRFDIYDTQTNIWTIGVLAQPIPAGASVISVNNTIYIAGGSVNGVLSNQVWKLEF
jgi:N-acetylneuraminic acid mutarotase